MTAIIGKFTKQSAEVLDYDIDFSPWFSKRSLTPDVLTVTVDDPALNIVASSRTGALVKIILSGGVNGTRYKVTVKLTSTSAPSLLKEEDFYVTIKDL